jgi:hypothetical protein
MKAIGDVESVLIGTRRLRPNGVPPDGEQTDQSRHYLFTAPVRTDQC